MSSLRTPVGPQPPVVYWRRRLLVLIGLVAIVVVILLIVWPRGSAEPDAGPTPGQTSERPTPAATDVDDSQACDPSAIVVEAITDAASYGAENQPLLSMSITNTGAVPCTLDFGTAAQEYVITSGTERIWSSKDCQEAPTSTPLVIAAGEEKSTTPFPWERIRSAAGNCGTDRPQVTAGGASYHLNVLLGEIASADTKQFVLN